MTDDPEKPFIRLEETDATTTDADGNPRVKFEMLDKSGSLPDAPGFVTRVKMALGFESAEDDD